MEYKILHTCIRVLDLEKSVGFYEKALGFTEIRRKDHPEHEFTLVFLSDANKTHELELTYNYGRKEPYTKGDGYSHLAVSVDDLEASRERHIEMGYAVTDFYGEPGQPPRYYFITDPDGYHIEILRA